MVAADVRGSVQLRGLLAPLLRPPLRSFSATSAGLRRLLASSLRPLRGRAPAPVCFSAIGRPGPSPLHFRDGALPLRPAGAPSRPLRYRPARFFSAPFPGAGRSLPGRHSFEALSLSAGPVLLRPFSRGGALSSRPVLLRGPFAIGRPGSSPHLFTGRGAPFPAGTPSRPFRYRPARFFSALFHGAGCFLSGLPVPLRDFRRYRAAANSLSRAISSGQRSSSGVSRMSGMPSKRASEAM